MLFLLMMLFSFHALPVLGNDAQTAISVNADQQYGYAEYCFFNRLYFEAVTEFRRFIFFFPKDERITAAAHRIGMSYYHLGQYDHAISAFSNLDENKVGVNNRFFVDSQYMISKSYQLLGNPVQALIVLFNLAAVSTDTIVKDEVYYRIGWIYIEMTDFGKALAAFENISAENRSHYSVERIRTEIGAGNSYPKKNPVLAGIFSLIPGAGYLYCGRYQDALVSLILNGALFYASAEAFDRDSPALGAILSVAGLGFYSGSIYGSITCAHKFNQKQVRHHIEKLKREVKIGILPLPENNGLALSLHYRFPN